MFHRHRLIRRRPALSAAALLLLAMVVPARAQLPVARLTSAFPPGAQRGSAVEVTLTGTDLDDLTALRFSDPRVTAAPVAGAPSKFLVTVPADLAPGTFDLRAVGRFGVSNPRAFALGTVPESVAKPGNTTPAAAAPLSFGQAVYAVAEANAAHFYKLALKKGRRVFVEVDARTIDSRLEPSIVLADPAGRDLVISRRGDVVDFTAPADADYLLKVHDFTFRGGPEFFYRLSAHAGPRIDFVHPPAGVPGTKGRYTLFGRNLPGGGPAPGVVLNGRPLEQLAVDIELPIDPQKQPATFAYVPSPAAFLDGVDYRLSAAGAVSNPVRIHFATAPVVASDPARASKDPQKLAAVPCEVAGRFLPRGERETFTFDAPANSVFWVEVFSARLGYPTAPFLLVQRVGKDDKGVEKITDVQEVYESPAADAGGAEFRTASRDPAYRLEVKEAGTHRVVLRNLFTTSADSAWLAYRLAVRKEAPDFQLAALPASPTLEKDSKEVPLWTPLLRRGGVTPIRVVAQRRDGFNGDIELAVEGLPAGVTCPPARIPAGATSAVLLLSASDTAEAAVAALRVTGVATVNGATVTRQARPGAVAASAYDAQAKAAEVSSRLSRELLIAVAAEPSPLAITPAADAPLETCVFNKLSIPLKLVRRGDFSGPMTLKLAGHPLVVPVKEITVEPAAADARFELDLSTVKLTPGEYTLHAEGFSKLDFRKDKKADKKNLNAAFYSAPIRLRVTAAPVTLAPPPPTAVEVGAGTELPVTLTRLYGYTDPVDLALVAPNVKGLTGTVNFPKDQTQAKLIIKTDAATPPGEHAVKLEAKLKLNNQSISVEQPIKIRVLPKSEKPVEKPATKPTTKAIEKPAEKAPEKK